VLGILLAIAVAVIAYILVPYIVDQWPALNRIITSGQNIHVLWPPSRERIIFTVVMWAVVFGSFMFVVALMVGRHPDEAENIKFQKEAAKRFKERQREKALERERRRRISRGG
jgi:hypothetical protein